MKDLMIEEVSLIVDEIDIAMQESVDDGLSTILYPIDGLSDMSRDMLTDWLTQDNYAVVKLPVFDEDDIAYLIISF